ncbi:MAG: hypothetical protein ACTHU0_17495 [Kofleriaceae bacterium]
MSHWVAARSLGCFIYFERPLAEQPVLARSMIEALVEGLELASTLQISTKNNFLRWRKFQPKAVEEALAKGETRSITTMVGTPSEVHLGGRLTLRLHPSFGTEFQSPPLAWFGAALQRWPEHRVAAVAQRWLELAAEHGGPLSGGILAAPALKQAKIEMTHEFETDPGEVPDRSPRSFRGRMEKDRSASDCWTKIRRVYPVTLLGPTFARAIPPSQLAGAGATHVQSVNGSVIFEAGEGLVEAWSDGFLADTRVLRTLLWPIMTQNPADDPRAPLSSNRGRGRT